MASNSPEINEQASIPFWRDVRVLGIIGQVIFVALVLAGLGWLVGNFIENAENQGLEIGFEFLNTTAAFDIGEGIEYSATDTFGRALWVGVVNTLRVSFIGIILTTFVGIITGIARLSNNWLVSKIAEVYIEIIRNVPLLVLLFFLYFGVILSLPSVRESIRPFNLPIFLSQRGISLPSLTPTIGFPIWLAFIILGFILVMALWTIQSRQEERTGEDINKIGSAIVVFIVVVGIGWFVTGNFTTNQAIMTISERRIEDFKDFEQLYLSRVDETALEEAGIDLVDLELNSAYDVADLRGSLNAQLETARASGASETAEAVQDQIQALKSASIVVCAVEESVGEINSASRLRQVDIEVEIENEDTMSEAGGIYSEGECDFLAGTQAELAAERAVLENPEEHDIVPVRVAPMVPNIPALAGFNIQGGMELSPEFAALLIGLVFYTGAFAAEIVRAGILSVSKGQTEAARALGLSEGQRLRLVVLPQALRVIIPPMTSQYLNLTKNSSLAVAIAFPDLVSVGNTVMNQSGFAVQVVILFMVVYLIISLSISAFLNWYNKKVALVER